MPNRLAKESSPYLLQHANNPVDWYPWSEEAFAQARKLERPIFLSIGYSACHWCHVMEHESFEDPATATLLNEHFISIKVDREERPDLDQIYMQSVQLMSGHGGWPMSTFLTAAGRPFFGGTYWPNERRHGMPSFREVLEAVLRFWRERRPEMLEQAEAITQRIQRGLAETRPPGELDARLLKSATAHLQRTFDHRNGGFGGRPKFPHPVNLRLLLRLWRKQKHEELLRMVTFTLDRMLQGGIYDQLGGGFHRYSVDERWLVPHFEKMLYDNALLLTAFAEAFAVTKIDDYARVMCQTADFVLREMTDPLGGFYSTLDADSEGEEGKYYVWSLEEITAALKDQAEIFCDAYNVTSDGNFDGHNILNLTRGIDQIAKLRGRDPQELADQLKAGREILFARRQDRIRPGLDDKVLVAWNGLMIEALAKVGSVLGESQYVDGAARAADFILKNLRQNDGGLLHSWRGGTAKFAAYLDDYACLGNSLITLYEATGDENWICVAAELADHILNRFRDPESGGFFYTAHDHETLIARTMEIFDNATPSGSSMAVNMLLRLGTLTGRSEYLSTAESALAGVVDFMDQAPSAMAQSLLALDYQLEPAKELVFVDGQDNEESRRVLQGIRQAFLPNAVIAHRVSSGEAAVHSPLLDSLFKERGPVNGQPTLYVCQNFSCQAPIVGAEEIGRAIAN